VNEASWWAYCNIEEHAVDIMYHKHGMFIQKARKMQIGPGYDTICSLNDEEFDNVLVLHGHPEDPEREKIFQLYVRRKIDQFK
jgi:hypothetical protein